MKLFHLGFLETAVTGVVGIGKSGVISRCAECPHNTMDWGTCGGFGEGCLLRRQPDVLTSSLPSPLRG